MRRSTGCILVSCFSALTVATAQAETGSAVAAATRIQLHILPFYESTLSPTGPRSGLAGAPPRNAARLQIRPDFELKLDPISVLVRPRAEVAAFWVEGQATDRPTGSSALFVNEWRAQLGLGATFVSYGQEVVQWGPSPFLSPSNPFFLNTGRANPEEELAGKGFAKVVTTVSDRVGLSLFLNTTAARGEHPKPFRPVFAWKLDYTGDAWSSSLLLSEQLSGAKTIGGFASATLGDAFLLYGEGALSRSSQGLYPTVSASSPLGFSMTRAHERRVGGSALAGGAYTFGFGTTLTAEVLYNSEGYSAADTRNYAATLSASVAGLASADPRIREAAVDTLTDALAPNLRTQRRLYTSVQLGHVNLWDQLDVFLRYTHGWDDRSGLLAPVFQWNFSDKWRAFAIAAITTGGPKDEFGSQFRYHTMVGLRLFAL
jgi:hypothetical protein